MSQPIGSSNAFDTLPPTAVIVVNYRAASLIEANLGSVALDPATFVVVVVDNFSSEADLEAIRAVTASHGWYLVEAATNTGFGGGVNLGIAEARRLGCESFLLVNPDAVMTAMTASLLRRRCLDDPAAVVAPRIDRPDGTPYSHGSVLDMSTGEVRGVGRIVAGARPSNLVPWLTGACLALSDLAFARVGGMDEGYFLYWEDVDFCYRAYQAGCHLLIDMDLVVVHDESGTQGRRRGRRKSDRFYYYNCRNRLRFGAVHLRTGLLLRWVVRTPLASWHTLLLGGRRQLLQSPMPLIAVIAGSVAGVWIVALELARRVLHRYRGSASRRDGRAAR